MATQDDIELLNSSLRGEYFGIAAYDAAVESGLLEPAVKEIAVAFQLDHRNHAKRLSDMIAELGGDSVAPLSVSDIAEELPDLKDQEDVLRYAVSLEQSAASGHLSTVAQLSEPRLAQLAASISGDEAMHWAVLLSALGENPVPVSFIPLPD